ncbi:MAG: hypothetical protein PVF58_00070 [Candidatus Methanofastidiosia archaeon]
MNLSHEMILLLSVGGGILIAVTIDYIIDKIIEHRRQIRRALHNLYEAILLMILALFFICLIYKKLTGIWPWEA